MNKQKEINKEEEKIWIIISNFKYIYYYDVHIGRFGIKADYITNFDVIRVIR